MQHIYIYSCIYIQHTHIYVYIYTYTHSIHTWLYLGVFMRISRYTDEARLDGATCGIHKNLPAAPPARFLQSWLFFQSFFLAGHCGTVAELKLELGELQCAAV